MSNQNQKVATIVGTAGMCSDDGRALSYYWRIFTNDSGGRGFYNEHYFGGDETGARGWCAERGYDVRNVAWM